MIQKLLQRRHQTTSIRVGETCWRDIKDLRWRKCSLFPANVCQSGSCVDWNILLLGNGAYPRIYVHSSALPPLRRWDKAGLMISFVRILPDCTLMPVYYIDGTFGRIVRQSRQQGMQPARTMIAVCWAFSFWWTSSANLTNNRMTGL